MGILWKSSGQELVTYADWRERLESKNRQQGTSAPTLAAAWAGPLEMNGALGHLRSSPT